MMVNATVSSTSSHRNITGPGMMAQTTRTATMVPVIKTVKEIKVTKTTSNPFLMVIKRKKKQFMTIIELPSN